MTKKFVAFLHDRHRRKERVIFLQKVHSMISLEILPCFLTDHIVKFFRTVLDHFITAMCFGSFSVSRS